LDFHYNANEHLNIWAHDPIEIRKSNMHIQCRTCELIKFDFLAKIVLCLYLQIMYHLN